LDGESRGTLKEVNFHNLKIDGSYNGADFLRGITSFAFEIVGKNAELNISHSDLNMDGWRVNSDKSYSAFPFIVDVKKLKVNHTLIEWLEDANSGGGIGCLFDTPSHMAGNKYVFKNTNVNLKNAHIFGRKGSGGSSVVSSGEDGTERLVFEDTTFVWENLPSDVDDRKYFGEVTNLYPDNKVRNNLKTRIGNKQFRIPADDFTKDSKVINFEFSTPLVVGQDMFEIIILNDLSRYTLEINYRNDYLKIVNDTDVVESNLITFGSRDSFVDSDGITKTRIIIKSNADTSNIQNLAKIDIYSPTFSWGIERITKI